MRACAKPTLTEHIRVMGWQLVKPWWQSWIGCLGTATLQEFIVATNHRL